MGFRAIGRILRVSNTAVLGWVKQAGDKVPLPMPEESVAVVEVDEMHTFVGQKKVTAGFGLRQIVWGNVFCPLFVEIVRRRRA